LCPKTPLELEEDVLSSISEIYELRSKEDIPSELKLILTKQQSSILPSYTYELKGTPHHMIKISKLQKKRFTAGLAITSAGEKLTPLLIFKSSGTRFNNLQNFSNYMMRKNPTAWNTSKIFYEYINQVIKPFVLAQRTKPQLKGKMAINC